MSGGGSSFSTSLETRYKQYLLRAIVGSRDVAQDSIPPNLDDVSLTDFNPSSASSTLKGSEIWRALIMDSYALGVITTLLRVGDLRRIGITLNVTIDVPRDPVPDVTAVYMFRAPSSYDPRPSVNGSRLENPKQLVDWSRSAESSREALAAACEDLRLGKYDHFEFLFCGECSDEALQELAAAASKGGRASVVHRVVQLPTSFSVLRPYLFELSGCKNTFYHLHASQSARDGDRFEAMLSSIAEGLQNVMDVEECMPYICAPRGHAAEEIARRLSQRLREQYHIGRAQEDYEADVEMVEWLDERRNRVLRRRPVLFVYDRSWDLSPALHHPWRYGELIHDLFGISQNRASIPSSLFSDSSSNSPPSDPSSPVQNKNLVIELSCEDDQYWREFSISSFTDVAEQVQPQLRELERDIAEVKRSANISDGDGGSSLEQTASADSSSAGLASGIRALPALLARKRQLGAHANTAVSIMSVVNSRRLFDLHVLEEPCSRIASAAGAVRSLVVGASSKSSSSSGSRIWEKLTPSVCRSIIRDARKSLSAFLAEIASSDLSSSSSTAKPLPEDIFRATLIVIDAMIALNTMSNDSPSSSSSSKGLSSSGVQLSEEEENDIQELSALAESAAHRIQRVAASLSLESSSSSSSNLPESRAPERLISFNDYLQGYFLVRDVKLRGSSVVNSGNVISSAFAKFRDFGDKVRAGLGFQGNDDSKHFAVTLMAECLAQGDVRVPDAYPGLALFDPVEQESAISGSSSVFPSRFAEVMPFCVGGGTYAEYDDLVEWSSRSGIGSLYGATEILSGSSFLDSINALGHSH